jgi:hypothetical protein
VKRYNTAQRIINELEKPITMQELAYRVRAWKDSQYMLYLHDCYMQDDETKEEYQFYFPINTVTGEGWTQEANIKLSSYMQYA